MQINIQTLGKKITVNLVGIVSLLLIGIFSLTLAAHTGAQSLEGSAQCGSNIDFSSKNCEAEQKKQEIARCLEQNPGATKKCTEEAEKSNTNRLNNVLATVINVMSAIGGAIAVLAIVLGGLNYVTSQGDAQKASSARSYIIYSLVGLLIIAFAQVIVQFVLERTT